jgi:LPXTG-site transpeptidase (sortase) family protein
VLLVAFVAITLLAGVAQLLASRAGGPIGSAGSDGAAPAQLLPPSTAERQQLTVAGRDAPIGYLTVAAIGLQRVPIYDRGLDARRQMLIASGTSVTHYSPSSPLGGTSNTVLYGHDDIDGSVFARLSQLQPGNVIVLDLGHGSSRTYRVVGKPHPVGPGSVGILTPTATPELTLFTCYPNFVDSARVVVVAVPQPDGSQARA